MFSWNISKSAEEMFSRWALKRLCQFLLKKKLGDFILGDIDLNQLDVQLRAGVIQLSDLALNVDYINEKFGTTAVSVKEGSVGSLSVTLPWNNDGCRIVVDELEIVLAPCHMKFSQDKFETSIRSKNRNSSSSRGFRNTNNETLNGGVANASVDVHEGVKTIAKMVKWLLTSFHVKVKQVIVAFDPRNEEESKGLDRILVLRIGEAECGTSIFEDPSSSHSTAAHMFLGLGRLTNFLKFEGAVLELVNVDGLDHQQLPECSTEANMGSWFPWYCSSGSMTTIIAGERGGFSGNLKLSLPWENGLLDIRRVDADLHIEPLELRLEPCSIRWLIFMWELFRDKSNEVKDPGHREPSDSVPAPSSCMLPSDKGPLSNEGILICCLVEKEQENVLLSESHLISDWVSRTQPNINEEEPDFGPSVDQFFECFDCLRNSQSSLGNSVMWNWTCSVFSAITAASNLASGSLHVPSEQQHVETNFNVAIAKISILLSFIDDEEKQSLKMKDDNIDVHFHTHCVCAQFVDLVFECQVYCQEMKFEVNVQHVRLVHHLCFKSDLVDYKVNGPNGNPGDDITSIQRIQDGVQDALLNFHQSKKDLRMAHQVDCPVNISLGIQDTDGCSHMSNGKYIFRKDASVTLLKTSGVIQCHVRINLGSSGGSLAGLTSFSLKLPPFVCWLNFDLITLTLDLLKGMVTYLETTSGQSDCAPDLETRIDGLSPLSDRGRASHQRSSDESNKRVLEGSIFLPNARIILCFPLNQGKEFSSYSPCNQFIAFDFTLPATGGKDVQSSKLMRAASSNMRHDVPTSCSLNLNIGDFDLFLITSDFPEKSVGSKTYNWLPARFSVEKIISAVNETGHMSLIRIFWQDGLATGPWIAKKAKLMASSENEKSEDKVVGKGCEFASVTTIRDIKDFDARTRQDILSSSAFIFHAQLPPVTINLDKPQYENICGLLNQMFEYFSCTASDSSSTGEEQYALQTSIIVEFDSVTVSIAMEPVGNVKSSMHSELPGSWLSLTIQVDNFEFLSVPNIGGITGASFLWLTHGQGSLWGSISGGLHGEFLLISCDDSTVGRGDGEGSNILSSRYSGSNIVNLWDPESNHNFTSVTVRCATIVAIGGRLDWFTSILSFFSQPPSDLDQAVDDSMEKACESSFILDLVDVGLSYEPYCKNMAANQGSDIKFSCLSANGTNDEFYVACLLAASSLKLSKTTAVDCTSGDYKIRLKDLGLLICTVSEPILVRSAYSVEHLRNTGYVKVAQEAHTEALLRTNCENGHMWELVCADSHIMLTTCHDTTSGLMRLAAQLQNLFAPDMQDYVVHLENRWNSSQQAHANSSERNLDGKFSSPAMTSGLDNIIKGNNFMDEIHEDVFQLDGSSDGQAKIFESQFRALVRDSSLVVSGALSPKEKIPEFIEEYFLSDLRPLSELALKRESPDNLYCKIGTTGETLVGGSGWYADTSLRILENHASKVEQTDVQNSAEDGASTSNSEHTVFGKAEGHILIKNMNINWRMYGGSDWCNSQNCSASCAFCRRDATACLELAFSGIVFDCDVYPDGEIYGSRISLSVQDFCLNDRSDNAPWKLVLGYNQSKKHPRKFSSKAVKLKFETVKPDPSIRIEENRLSIAVLPLRLHLHQSQLDFLISFFGGKSSSADPSSVTPRCLSKSGEPLAKSVDLQARSMSEEAFLPYFQKFDIWPMLIRVDYSPCRVDLTALRDGKYVELVNLVPWKAVELQLKHVQGVGIYGWGGVCETILGEWLEDISQNQIHKLLKGLPPIKSLVAVGSGAAKLVSLPVKSYKKDHRLLKGMQRGTFAFLRSISLEAIGLGVHLAAGAQDILLQAEYILASIPPSVPWPAEIREGIDVKSNQPKDAQQGIQQACQSISDGLGKSAAALVQTPVKKYQRGAGMGSALATAVQSAPAAAIAPASAAARAVHCALLGFRNSLDPEHKRESLEKYLGRTPPPESLQ